MDYNTKLWSSIFYRQLIYSWMNDYWLNYMKPAVLGSYFFQAENLSKCYFCKLGFVREQYRLQAFYRCNMASVTISLCRVPKLAHLNTCLLL